MRIKSLIIRVDTMHRPWLAVKMAVVFHYICFCEPVAQYENKVLVVTWIFLEENPVLLVRCCLPFTQKLQCYVVQWMLWNVCLFTFLSFFSFSNDASFKFNETLDQHKCDTTVRLKIKAQNIIQKVPFSPNSTFRHFLTLCSSSCVSYLNNRWFTFEFGDNLVICREPDEITS